MAKPLSEITAKSQHALVGCISGGEQVRTESGSWGKQSDVHSNMVLCPYSPGCPRVWTLKVSAHAAERAHLHAQSTLSQKVVAQDLSQ